MSRSTCVYFGMLAAFAVGIWLTMSIGSLMSAPEDLSGDWELIPVDAVAAAREGIEHDPTPMVVEQSGRFFKISIDNDPPLRMKLTDESVIGHGPAAHKRLKLTAEGLEGTFVGQVGSDHWDFRLVGQVSGAWHGTLVSRTYAKDAATQPSE